MAWSVALDCANAEGCSGGDVGHWQAGAANAALLAAEILAASDAALYERLAAWRAARAEECWGKHSIRSCR